MPIPASEQKLELGWNYDVAISPDGRFLVTGSSIGERPGKDTDAHVWTFCNRKLREIWVHTKVL